MQRIAGHLAFLIVLALWAVDVTWASDIACPHAYRPRCDVSAPAGTSCADPPRQRARGSQLICDYAMLHESYEGIYADQQRRRYAGTLRKGDLDAWRRKRDACTSVRCLDQLFADWRRAPQESVTRDAPRKPPAMAESPAIRRASPSAGAAPIASPAASSREAEVSTIGATDEPHPVAPVFETVPASLRDSLQPLPPGTARAATRGHHAPTAFGWLAWLSWMVVALAAGGGFYWLVVRKQATRYLDAAFASASSGLSWVKTLPPLALILTGLALLNGVLLIVLLGG